MGDKGRQSKDPFELDQLLAEMESLQAQLSEHQRSMAILFADLKGFTAIFGQLGDADGLLALQRSESLIRPIVSSHSGTVIKTIGDAVMAHFPAANEAVRAAMAIQHAVVEHNVGVPPEKQIALRMGINVGKGYVKGRDIFGQVVNIASKVQSAAEAGQILASQMTVQALEPELAKRAEESDSLKFT
ncbi:MAG: adenylate/guanylate cyclase domain-containing protein, partial [Nitrospinae bacterium]|nr:adenylate/guanylate cyclase domain-containing protein [Nitrospinota bacterium]